ncbi:MAG: prenyltransferase [Acidimicrobiales bacterium]|nr:prenyltransferase [Acidimicrobiales bacterium]
MRTVSAFVRLSRPHFLLGGVLLFAVGAFSGENVDAVRYAIAQVMVTAAQITAHYVNEYADVEVDSHVTNRTFFSGGSGVLTADIFDPRVARHAASISSAVAVGTAAIVATYSIPVAMLGLATLAVSWAYSMPPVRLLDTGLGELATTLVVAAAVPLIGSLAQGGSPSASLWWSIAILAPIHFAMMLAFEIPDLETDAEAGKRVLAVRIGRASTIWLMVLLVVAAGIVAAVAGLTGAITAPAAWGVLAGGVPVLIAAAGLRKNNYPVLTAAAVATLVVAGVALLVGS